MIELEKSATVSFWCNHIDQYRKDADKWYQRSRKIVKRYKDERPDGKNNVNQFNILWSNVQTLAPALYDKNPIPNIDRRFQSDDKLGTTSAQVLERCVSFFTEADEFGDIMRQSVLDRLLAGRGTAWVRYVPNFRDVTIQGNEDILGEGVQATDDAETDEVEQELVSEDVVVDFVHYEDFGHCFAKTWQEVRAVWRAVPLSRKELVERFGEEIGSKVPMDAGRKDEETPDDYKRATVFEIWDKTERKVYWINKSYPEVLDEREDPLRLSGFFPCPKPIYATIANDKLIPTPDYVQYQDQAKELDELTGRISNIISALRVAGVYDASAPALSKLLDGSQADNILIPVDQWALFGEKGGLKGVIDFLPIKEVGEVLIGLYQARDRTKQELYEVTGISDIIRGASNPNETLGAQELKGKYAGLRMGAMQADVARFCRDIVRIFAEIIAEHFSPETIKQISGIKLMTAEEKAMYQQAQAIGQQVPTDESIQEMLVNPTWDDVIALLKDDTARSFRISIETDSTIKQDQDAEKAARTEFLTAASGFIQQAAQVQNPDLAPLLMEMLKFGVKGFKIGREMETTFDVVMQKMKKQAEQPTPQADPMAVEKEKAQAELQMKQADAQAKLQADAQKAQTDAQLKSMEIQSKEQIELKRLEQEAVLERERMAIDAQLRKYEIDLRNAQQQTTVMTNIGE